MTDWTAQSMVDDPHILTRRLASYVRPRASAKDLSRLVGCDVRTAENIRAGHWPIARHWIGLIATFGEDLTDAVFYPHKAAARLEREVRDLESLLAKRRADLVHAESTVARLAKIRARNEDASLTRGRG